MGGLYRHVRNPMYLAVVARHGRPGVAALAAGPGSVRRGHSGRGVAVFVLGYRAAQPATAGMFGSKYEDYRRAVPAWWPRLRPWQPEQEQRPLWDRGSRP